MKAKWLSFVSFYFLGSGLIKGLWAKKIENSAPISTRLSGSAGACQRMQFSRLLARLPGAAFILQSRTIVEQYSDFVKQISPLHREVAGIDSINQNIGSAVF